MLFALSQQFNLVEENSASFCFFRSWNFLIGKHMCCKDLFTQYDCDCNFIFLPMRCMILACNGVATAPYGHQHWILDKPLAVLREVAVAIALYKWALKARSNCAFCNCDWDSSYPNRWVEQDSVEMFTLCTLWQGNFYLSHHKQKQIAIAIRKNRTVWTSLNCCQFFSCESYQ